MAGVVDEVQVDEIRRHARYGAPPTWPYHKRRIYDSEKTSVLANGEEVQRVWESDFLHTEPGELYFALALFGLELTITWAARR
jgi:hypothetical protein